LNLLPYFLH